MTLKLQIITAFVYILITFTLAFIWHLVLFPSFYDRIGYFGDEEPIIALGMLTILIQGVLFAYAYPFFQKSGSSTRDAARITMVFTLHTAAIHILAAAAKHHAPATWEWFLFEGLFFLTQFVITTTAFSLLHASKRSEHHA